MLVQGLAVRVHAHLIRFGSTLGQASVQLLSWERARRHQVETLAGCVSDPSLSSWRRVGVTAASSLNNMVLLLLLVVQYFFS